MNIYVDEKFNFIKEIDKSSPIHKGTFDIKISSRHHSKNTIHYIYNSNNNKLLVWCRNKYNNKFQIHYKLKYKRKDIIDKIILICGYNVLLSKEIYRINTIRAKIMTCSNNYIINNTTQIVLGNFTDLHITQNIINEYGNIKQLNRQLKHSQVYIKRINKKITELMKGW